MTAETTVSEQPAISKAESKRLGLEQKKETSTVLLTEKATNIASRLQAAVSVRPGANRSSDLVLLNHEFERMRKQLRALIAATKRFHESMKEMEMARAELQDFFFRYSQIALFALYR